MYKDLANHPLYKEKSKGSGMGNDNEKEETTTTAAAAGGAGGEAGAKPAAETAAAASTDEGGDAFVDAKMEDNKDGADAGDEKKPSPEQVDEPKKESTAADASKDDDKDKKETGDAAAKKDDAEQEKPQDQKEEGEKGGEADTDDNKKDSSKGDAAVDQAPPPEAPLPEQDKTKEDASSGKKEKEVSKDVVAFEAYTENPVKEEAAKDGGGGDAKDKKDEEDGKDAATKKKTMADEQKGDFMSMGLGLLIILVVMVVVLAVVLVKERNKEEQQVEPDATEPPIAAEFATGVSLMTYYGVNATIRSRLARTALTMRVANALDCVSIHSVTLQLPLHARVASLQTKSETDDGCDTTGKVMPLAEARETFAESALEGLPGGYVEARDSFTYSVQVSIPPLGAATVELVLEELLEQRAPAGTVEYKVPFVPNEPVDQVVFDLTIHDVSEANIRNATLDLGPDMRNVTAVAMVNNNTFHLDIPNAPKYELPSLVEGSFRPNDLPESGTLTTDGTCFEHYFHPPDLDVMPKNIVFLMDVSESMSQDDKLGQAKEGVKGLVDMLTPEDSLFIQAFAGRGTLQSWGYGTGTNASKQEAKQWVDDLQPAMASSGTYLHEALLEGMLRANKLADEQQPQQQQEANANATTTEAVTILVLLSDGMPSVGETNRSKIAEDVLHLNQDGKVKIYSMGFEDNADLALLRALAITNGGTTAPIHHGDGGDDDGIAEQMKDFFEREFGKIVLSNVKVEISASVDNEDKNVFGVTRSTFPVLSEGTEVVVRGLLAGDDVPPVVHANATALTSRGNQTWSTWGIDTTTTTENDGNYEKKEKNSICFQSYAHARITQLLHWRDAAELLGDDVVRPIVSLVEPCPRDDTTLAECIESEALKLALEANVVTSGLTGLVTEPAEGKEEICANLKEDATEICLDGSSSTHPLLTPDNEDAGEEGLAYEVSEKNAGPTTSINGGGGDADYMGSSSSSASSFGPSPVAFMFLLVTALYTWLSLGDYV